jgi:hypothetical protein
MFLLLPLLGLIITGVFFLNLLPKGTPFELPSAGIIPLCNIAICIKVGAGLYLVFILLTTFKPGGDK